MISKKFPVDIVAIICTIVCIVTGVLLHIDVWHRFVYDNKLLWGIHEGVGLLLALLIIVHCVQHSFWFTNYTKLPIEKKRVTTLFLAVAVIVSVTGIVLWMGSRSHLASRIHLITGILFVAIGAGHVWRRWKLFSSLLKSNKR